jgi:hypothetical protein
MRLMFWFLLFLMHAGHGKLIYAVNLSNTVTPENDGMSFILLNLHFHQKKGGIHEIYR